MPDTRCAFPIRTLQVKSEYSFNTQANGQLMLLVQPSLGYHVYGSTIWGGEGWVSAVANYSVDPSVYGGLNAQGRMFRTVSFASSLRCDDDRVIGNAGMVWMFNINPGVEATDIMNANPLQDAVEHCYIQEHALMVPNQYYFGVGYPAGWAAIIPQPVAYDPYSDHPITSVGWTTHGYYIKGQADLKIKLETVINIEVFHYDVGNQFDYVPRLAVRNYEWPPDEFERSCNKLRRVQDIGFNGVVKNWSEFHAQQQRLLKIAK